MHSPSVAAVQMVEKVFQHASYLLHLAHVWSLRLLRVPAAVVQSSEILTDW